jgi:hypothetical protein
MKRPLFLIASLLLNIALVVAIFAARRETPVAPETLVTPVATVTRATAESAAPVLTQTNEVRAPFHWSEMESTDYFAYKSNLLALGCPEQRLRDILIADVDALFADRVRDYVAPLQQQFWEIASRPQELEDVIKKHQEALREMERERSEIFTALFNESDPRRSGRNQSRQEHRLATRHQGLDFLEEPRRNDVIGIEDELSRALSAAQVAARSGQFAGTRDEAQQQRQATEKEARAAADEKLRGRLTAEEFAEYKLRQSAGANVRRQLTHMDLSETDARSIAQVLAARAAQETELRQQSSQEEFQKAQVGLRQRAEEQIKQLLGDAGYAEYQRAQDWRFAQTARVTERLELPTPTALAIYQAQVDADKLAAQVRADAAASPDERAAALGIIRTEAERTIRNQLGEQNFRDYRNNSTRWFEALSPEVR